MDFEQFGSALQIPCNAECKSLEYWCLERMSSSVFKEEIEMKGGVMEAVTVVQEQTGKGREGKGFSNKREGSGMRTGKTRMLHVLSTTAR